MPTPFFDPSVDMLARRLVRPVDAHVRVPVQPPAYLRQGVITHVNTGASQVHLQLGGSDVVIPNVTYIQHYSPVHQPQVNHTCWVWVNGKQLLVAGQHIASPFETI